MHAVIVDPSQVVLKLIAKQFAERGDVSSTFVNSQQALDKVHSDKSVDIVLTSLEVSPIAGLELCWESRLLSNRYRPIYIAVMSSIGNTANIAQALDSGADDLILKPVCRHQLHARLRTVSRLHSTQRDLVRLAEIDGLTGVLNRRAFFDRVYNFFEAPCDEPLSAIMLDMDHFKLINDAHGHEAGDKVLKDITHQATMKDMTIGRLGGEEFAMLLPGRDADDTYHLAEEFRQECSELVFESEKGPFNVTCSIGVAERVKDDTPDTLLRRADIALYEAKTGGRNQVCIREHDESGIIPDARTRPAPRIG